MSSYSNYFLGNEDDIKGGDNEAFRCACANGHIEIVELLLPYLNEDDIKSVNNQAFKYACINESNCIAQLLIDACPDLEHHPSNEEFKLTPSLPPK